MRLSDRVLHLTRRVRWALLAWHPCPQAGNGYGRCGTCLSCSAPTPRRTR